MGDLRDRGMKVASYLRGVLAYPVKFDYRAEGGRRGFVMPDPFELSFTMRARANDVLNDVREATDRKGLWAVAYGYRAHDMEKMLVIMPLKVYTTLVKQYLDTETVNRMEGSR